MDMIDVGVAASMATKKLQEEITNLEEQVTEQFGESVAEAVSNWMDENIDGDGEIVVDSSLLVEGAAAESKIVGEALAAQSDEIDEVKSAIKDEVFLKLSTSGSDYQAFDVKAGISYLIVNRGGTVGTNLRTVNGTGGNVEMIDSSFPATGTIIWTPQSDAPRMAVQFGVYGGEIYVTRLGTNSQYINNILFALAQEYSSNKTYAVGDVVQFCGAVKVCKTAITTAEEFDSSKWNNFSYVGQFAAEEKRIEENVSNISGGFSQFAPASIITGEQAISFSDWEAGSLDGSGNETNSTTTLRSKYFHHIAGDTLTVSITAGNAHTCNIFWYSYANGVYTYVGKSNSFASSYVVTIDKAYYYRFVLTKTNASSTADINTSYYTFTIKTTNSISSQYITKDYGAKVQSNEVNNIRDLAIQTVPLSAVSGSVNIVFDDWEVGNLDASGNEQASTTALRSKYFHALVGEKLTLSITAGYSHTANIIWYSFANGVYTYVGKSGTFASSYELDINPQYYYRFVATKTNASSTSEINLNYFTFTITNSDSIAKKYANENVLSPDFETIDLPSGVGTWQSIEHIGDEVWLCNESSAVGGTVNGKIYRVTDDFSQFIGVLNHNIGHLNGASYDPQNKRFLTGSASNNASETPKIWIYDHADDWLEIAPGGSIAYDNLDKTEINLSGLVENYGALTYITPCWGERNANGNKSIYINAGVNTKWLKIIPRMGTAEGEYGTYTAADEGKYNGTFDLIEFYTYENHQLNETVDSHVCQGLAMYKGALLTAMSHSCILAARYTKNLSGIMKREIIRMQYVDDDGDFISNTQNEGILVMDGFIYSGLSNATNPKLAKWQI